jgi:PAS domain S-box-containing protein
MRPLQSPGADDPSLAGDIFAGGGEMGALMRQHDWSRTPVGPVADWPQSLRTALSILLASGYPMYIAWGPEFVQFYNDAYRPILGATKHPAALGQGTRECFAEIWDIIGPMFDRVMATGEETTRRDQILPMDRFGFLEECYFDFSYSPIRDETGGVGGVFVTCMETTGRVLGERRLRILRDLGERAATAKQDAEACRAAAEILAANPPDVPFALLYLLDADGERARLVAAAGMTPNRPSAPEVVRLDGRSSGGWPLAEAVEAGHAIAVDDLIARFGRLPGGPWPESPHTALVLPLAAPGQERPTGLLVAGVSPRLALDGDYRGFLDLVAGQVATAVVNARAYEEERRRAEALAELDRAKTVFFSNVSHEFRTPLTLLLAPLEDALAGETLPAAERERLEVAYRNAVRLLKLVNTLLDFARIEAGRIDASFEPTDLATLTVDLVSTFRSAVERAGLRLVVECPPLPEPVHVDRDMWEKIVLNLLSNAFKHTFAGEIAVGLRRVEGSVELVVRDTGVGIPTEELPRLFDRFHRVRGARARSHEGSGIGLALVQELVRLHGGTIAAESVVDQGTTFTVRLPIGAAHLPSDRIGAPRTLAPAAANSAAYVEEALRWLPGEAAAVTGPAGARADGVAGQAAYAFDYGGGPSIEDARILVADDNADMRAYLARLLGGRWTVELAQDGAAALDAARLRRPDLVLADVMMPRMDGFALLRELRADTATRQIPVVLLSARAGEEARVEGLEAGADDYLVKPFSARELMARVGAHLALARLRAEVETERNRLRELFQQAPILLAVLEGPDHVFTFANPVYERAVGRRDILGKPIREALPEVARQVYLHLLNQVYATGEPYVGTEAPTLLDRHGTGEPEEAFFDFVYQPLCAGDGPVTGILVCGVDVTEQVRTRRELQRQHQLIRTIADNATLGLFLMDKRQHCTFMNPAAEQMTGFSLDEVQGRPLHEFVHHTHPDGTPYPLEDCPINRALPARNPMQGEEVFVHKDGTFYPVAFTASPVVEHDEPVGTVIEVQDITARRAAEREREALLEAERSARAAVEDALRLRDVLVAGISHDLKTPLATIKGTAQLVARQAARPDGVDTERLSDAVRRIDVTTTKMTDLLNEMIDVARLQAGQALELQRAPMDLVALVKECIDEQQPAAATHQVRLETDLPELVGEWDRVRLGRVVTNLISNAVKFSPAGGRVRLAIVRDDSAAGPHAWAMLTVRDRGMGIPAADVPHIFERFRRGTNVTGRIAGTGLGLAVVQRIVEQHGGSVAVESCEGRGSTFTVRLPLAPLGNAT